MFRSSHLRRSLCCLREYAKPSLWHLNYLVCASHQKTAWFKPGRPFPDFLKRDKSIQNFPRPYWNILPSIKHFMKKQRHPLNLNVLFSVFSEKTTWFKTSICYFSIFSDIMVLSKLASPEWKHNVTVSIK